MRRRVTFVGLRLARRASHHLLYELICVSGYARVVAPMSRGLGLGVYRTPMLLGGGLHHFVIEGLHGIRLRELMVDSRLW